MILIKATFSGSTPQYVAKTNCSFHPIDGSILEISEEVEFTKNADLAIDFSDSVRADNWIAHFHQNSELMENYKIDFFDLTWKS